MPWGSTKLVLGFVFSHDFITGDFNLFANRQFKTDTGGTYIGGVVVEVLEDVVLAMNDLDWKNKITFNISSSTPPQDVFDTITQDSQTGNLDCMLCISVFYNRQGFDTERSERITPHLHLAPDYIGYLITISTMTSF